MSLNLNGLTLYNILINNIAMSILTSLESTNEAVNMDIRNKIVAKIQAVAGLISLFAIGRFFLVGCNLSCGASTISFIV